MLNKAISQSGLKGRDVTILAVDRSGEIIANPSAETKIRLKDDLICFGKLDNIRAVSEWTRSAVSEEEGSNDKPPAK